ncbi:MAG: dicarboxylate/amino acid:cation symporter [Clostridia bacterium]|nr:dicarboxylate/amino acid:cation symporter [Clostridia bacterium]MBR6039253.1 dicarboxylate/amino acid:cation symporter [Clostridia bacterium]
MEQQSPKKRTNLLPWITLACFVAGAVLGLLWPRLFSYIGFIGTVYVNLLKLMALPIVLCTVFGAASRGVKNATGTLLKTVLLFVILFTVSFLLSGALYAALKPGEGFTLTSGEAWTGSAADLSLEGFLTSIFSPNIFASLGSGAMLPTILFAFFMGAVAGRVGANRVMTFVAELETIFSRMLSYILWLTPLGVFVLMGKCTADFGAQALGGAVRYVLYAWGGCILILLLVMILPLWIFCRIDPITYFRKTGRVLLSAISTCSSAATLPETLRTCREEFEVPERVSGVVAPLGCTIHMCGGAVSFCLLAMFTMQMSGRPVTVGTFLLMLLFAEALNMAAPGIPGGGIVLGATFLGLLGMSDIGLFLGMYAGIYRLLDMAYTALNVTGDVTAVLLIRKWEDRKQ